MRLKTDIWIDGALAWTFYVCIVCSLLASVPSLLGRSGIEAGRRSPSMDLITRICERFHIKPGKLTAGYC